MARMFKNGTDVIVEYDENKEEILPISMFNKAYDRDLNEELRWKKERREQQAQWFEWVEKIIEYYDIFETMVRACGDLVGTEKFRQNLYRHWGDRTWSPVLEVRKDYPKHGDRREINSKASSIDALLTKLNEAAVNISLPKMTKKELSELKNDILSCDTHKRQKKYYRRIEKYRSSFEIHPLQEWLEDEIIVCI